jgi:hypothetical protein
LVAALQQSQSLILKEHARLRLEGWPQLPQPPDSLVKQPDADRRHRNNNNNNLFCYEVVKQNIERRAMLGCRAQH